jgi:inward rectifier potassium channel
MPRRPRRQNVDLGSFQAVKIGAPPAVGDLYYLTMEMSWPTFVGLVTAVFVAINFAFGLIYALIPGQIANAASGSVADGFFFSVETLATVGYGNMAPASYLAHAIAAVEILIGLFFSATITGLIFARFARPRDSLVFSRVAVVSNYEDKPALMVRVASTRSRPLVDVTAQMAWLERVELPDGRVFRRLVDLPLVRSHNPMLGLSWTLVHLLDDDSAVLAAWSGNDRFTLTVGVSGLDTLLASQSQGRQSYDRESVLADHDFADAITDNDGELHLDLARLHDVTLRT